MVDGKEFVCVNVHLFWNPTVTDVKSKKKDKQKNVC